MIFRRPSNAGTSNSLNSGDWEGTLAFLAIQREQMSALQQYLPSLESFGFFWTFKDSFRIFWNFWNLLESFGIFRILLESLGLFWNFLGSFGIFGFFCCLCRMSLQDVSAGCPCRLSLQALSAVESFEYLGIL